MIGYWVGCLDCGAWASMVTKECFFMPSDQAGGKIGEPHPTIPWQHLHTLFYANPCRPILRILGLSETKQAPRTKHNRKNCLYLIANFGCSFATVGAYTTNSDALRGCDDAHSWYHTKWHYGCVAVGSRRRRIKRFWPKPTGSEHVTDSWVASRETGGAVTTPTSLHEPTASVSDHSTCNVA